MRKRSQESWGQAPSHYAVLSLIVVFPPKLATVPTLCPTVAYAGLSLVWHQLCPVLLSPQPSPLFPVRLCPEEGTGLMGHIKLRVQLLSCCFLSGPDKHGSLVAQPRLWGESSPPFHTPTPTLVYCLLLRAVVSTWVMSLEKPLLRCSFVSMRLSGLWAWM